MTAIHRNMRKGLDDTQTRVDETFMRRCIELADIAASKGDLPFGAIVVRNGQIIGEGYNTLQHQYDARGHAQGIAMTQAQQHLQSRTLEDCTLYTTSEPCCMCSQPARELMIPRIVWSLYSLEMGGYSRYGILNDAQLQKKISNRFGPPPKVVGGVLRDEYIACWKRWDPDNIAELLKEKIFA